MITHMTTRSRIEAARAVADVMEQTHGRAVGYAIRFAVECAIFADQAPGWIARPVRRAGRAVLREVRQAVGVEELPPRGIGPEDSAGPGFRTLRIDDR